MDENSFQQKQKEFKNCSFCNTSRENVFTIIIGDNACICPNCVLGTYKHLIQKKGYRQRVHMDEYNGTYQTLRNGTIVIILLVLILLLLFFFV